MLTDLFTGHAEKSVTTQEYAMSMAMANKSSEVQVEAQAASVLNLTTGSSEYHTSLATPRCIGHPPGGSNASTTKSSDSMFFSPRIQRMIESRDTFSTELEFDIEYSKSHWTVMEMDDDVEYSPEDDRIYFEELKKHVHWGEFFKEFDDLVVGEKIGEGAQAEIYEAQLTRNGIKSDYYDLVVKVMKRGYALRSLQRQWPLGMLNFARSSSDFCTNPSSISGRTLKGSLNWIKGGTLLKDERLKGQFAFVMDRQWGDLRKLIDLRMQRNNNQGPPFNNDQVLGLMRDIAWDMESLHNETPMILHRDLKASNVLIFSVDLEASDQKFFNAMVIDYECSMGVVGTGFWRAPEILQQLKDRISCFDMEFTSKADVFSFGMTCYEIVTGHMPFEDDASSNFDIILHGRRPTLPDCIDPLVKEIIIGCWLTDPLQRPSFTSIRTMIHQAINWRRKNQITWDPCKMKERDGHERKQEGQLKEWGKNREEWDRKWDRKMLKGEWNDREEWEGLQHLHTGKEEEHQREMLEENKNRLTELEEGLEELTKEQENYGMKREEQENRWGKKRHELDYQWKQVHEEREKDQMEHGTAFIVMEDWEKGFGKMDWEEWEMVFIRMEYEEWELMSWRRRVATWRIQWEEWRKWRIKVHRLEKWVKEKHRWEEWEKNEKWWKELDKGVKEQRKEEKEWKEWEKKEWNEAQNWWKEWEEWAMTNKRWAKLEGLHEKQKNAWKELRKEQAKRERWWKESKKWWKEWEKKVERPLEWRENEQKEWHEWNEALGKVGDPLIWWRRQLFQQSDSPSPDWLQYNGQGSLLHAKANCSDGKPDQSSSSRLSLPSFPVDPHSLHRRGREDPPAISLPARKESPSSPSFSWASLPLSAPKFSHMWATPGQFCKRRIDDNEKETELERMQRDQKWYDEWEENMTTRLRSSLQRDDCEDPGEARPDVEAGDERPRFCEFERAWRLKFERARGRGPSLPVVVSPPLPISDTGHRPSPSTYLSAFASKISSSLTLSASTRHFSPSTTHSASTPKISPSTTHSASTPKISPSTTHSASTPNISPSTTHSASTSRISPSPLRNSSQSRHFFSASDTSVRSLN